MPLSPSCYCEAYDTAAKHMFQNHPDKRYTTMRNGNRQVYFKGTNHDGSSAGLVVCLLLSDQDGPADLRLDWAKVRCRHIPKLCLETGRQKQEQIETVLHILLINHQ